MEAKPFSEELPSASFEPIDQHQSEVGCTFSLDWLVTYNERTVQYA